MSVSENIRFHWDEFQDFCEDNGILMEYEDDWGPWWECWKKAIETKEEYDKT